MSKNAKINNANIFCKYFSSDAKLLKNKAMLTKDFAWGSPVEITSRIDKEVNFEYVSKIFIERELRLLNWNEATDIGNLNTDFLTLSSLALSLNFKEKT